MTNPGEWPMNPDLGIGVRKYLFENYGSPELGKIQERIRNQLQRYLPFPYIQMISAKLEATPEEQDQGYANLKIRYAILDDLVRSMIITRDGISTRDISVADIPRHGFLRERAGTLPSELSSNMRTTR